VWPDTVVEEVNLTVNISVLRKALGGENGRDMIQTVPAHGYRFVVPITTRDVAVALELQGPVRKPGMLHPDTDSLLRPVTRNADAYRAYLQGRHDWNQRSEESLKRAIESFQRAVYIDPTFAAAYSGLADCHAALGYLSYIAPADAFLRSIAKMRGLGSSNRVHWRTLAETYPQAIVARTGGCGIPFERWECRYVE
jgi:hypothetical protein